LEKELDGPRGIKSNMRPPHLDRVQCEGAR